MNSNIPSILLMLCYSAFLVSCTAQISGENKEVSNNNQHTMNEKFDVDAFKQKIAQDPGYTGYYLEDSTHIQQFGDDESGYVEKSIPPTGHFIEYQHYTPNGNLDNKGQIYKRGTFKKSIWMEYDKNGEITNQHNHDTPFKYSFEKVLKYLRKQNIDITKKGNDLHRTIENGQPVWYVIWNSGEFEEDYYIMKNIQIDGVTGSVTEMEDSYWMDN